MLEFLKRLFRRPRAPSEGSGTGQHAAVVGQRRAEEGLRRTEEEFAKLVAGVRDYAIYLLDAEGRVLTWNAGAERINGYTAGEIIGQSSARFYPSDDVARDWPAQELREAAAAGRYESQGWRLRKDGGRYWADVVLTALRNEAGGVRGFLKITRDLTERRRAEEGLRQSEERFSLLVAGVKEYAIFMLDPQGHIATWNAGAERIKGYTAEEIIGQHFSRFYPKEALDLGTPARELEIAVATGMYQEEGWRLRKDGSRFWASVVITALRDERGELRGFAKVTRDMTERRAAEESTRRLLQEEAARQAAQASAEEARHAQAEERRQREQLRVTLESIGDGVIVTDRDGRVTFVNPVAARTTGWNATEASGQRLEVVFPIFNEETRAVVENPVSKVLRHGAIVGLANHTVLRARDGREVPIDDSAAPIRGDDGTIGGVVLVFRDVSEARRAVETRLHLAAIVESTDDAIISIDLKGVVVSWNRGAERLYGYSADEMVGKPLSVVIPADHPDELPTLMERIGRGEQIDHFETVRRRKDGTLINVSLTISPVHNAEGKITGASKIARDITAAKRNEESLRFLADASKLLAEVLDIPSTLQKVAGLAVPQFATWCAVDMLESDGALRRVAVAHADPAKVELARELYNRYPPLPTAERGPLYILRTGRSEIVPAITDAMIEQSSRGADWLAIMRELRLRSYMGVPLTVRGKSLGVLTFVASEGSRPYGPSDLRMAEDLGRRAAVAIDNARLYSDLREADHRKDEFLAMLGHELRNPLAPIRNALHVMKMPGAQPEVIEQARDMTERQVQHMVRLVDDLLDVSRIMRGRIELRREAVDLAALVAAAVETAQPMIDAQGQQLIVSVPDEPVRLDVDATRITQVIANLLNNAAKFSDRSGRIWVTVESAGDAAVVRVRDEGAGIRPEMLSRIFDLFVQGDASLERSRGGLGIGLTVVQRLVALHGGRVEAHSEGRGKGAEFVIRLPRLQDAPQPELPQPARLPAPVERRHRVLVVDDNTDAAESAGVLLRLWGHDVRLAFNGPEALEAAATFNPEVVLLDIGLPGMNGYEVARHLRSRPHSLGITLIAVTGYGQESDRMRTAEAGFDRHLTKPVDPEQLRTMIAASDPATNGSRH